MWNSVLRHLPDVAGMVVMLGVHLWIAIRYRAHQLLLLLAVASFAFTEAGFLLSLPAVWTRLHITDAMIWARGVALGWSICLTGTIAAWAIARGMGRVAKSHDPGRRSLLRAAQAAVVAAPAVMIGAGVLLERRQLRAAEVRVRVPGLPKDLDGLRIAQLSDVHLSPFVSEKELTAAVDLANSFRPHVSVVTGDLITRPGDPLDAGIAGIARLRADAGVFGCMGNHETLSDCEEYLRIEAAKRGMEFLRRRNRELRFGAAKLNIAGVDYERMRSPYLSGAERMLIPGAFNLLLSHNPDAFRVAPAQGWDLMLAGHTHGGQISVEILHEHMNVARFFTPYTYGQFQEGRSHLYVTRGIGTVGLPARIGAPPEVALITLCAT